MRLKYLISYYILWIHNRNITPATQTVESFIVLEKQLKGLNKQIDNCLTYGNYEELDYINEELLKIINRIVLMHINTQDTNKVINYSFLKKFADKKIHQEIKYYYLKANQNIEFQMGHIKEGIEFCLSNILENPYIQLNSSSAFMNLQQGYKNNINDNIHIYTQLVDDIKSMNKIKEIITKAHTTIIGELHKIHYLERICFVQTLNLLDLIYKDKTFYEHQQNTTSSNELQINRTISELQQMLPLHISSESALEILISTLKQSLTLIHGILQSKNSKKTILTLLSDLDTIQVKQGQEIKTTLRQLSQLTYIIAQTSYFCELYHREAINT